MAKTVDYVWTGTKRGQKVSGELSGESAPALKTQLRRQGIAVRSFKKKPQPLFSQGKKITPADIAVFTRQMATMLRAGVPLVQGLGMVVEGLSHPRLAKIISAVQDEVASGTAFAAALRQHPQQFDDLYCSLIEAGEQTGALETLLDRVATYKEKAEALKKKVKKAMIYPIAVLVVAAICTGVLLVKVVPQFAETFASFDAELPAFTQMVLRISESMQATWYLYLVAIAGLIFLHRRLYRSAPKYIGLFDANVLKMPVIGDILYKGVLARFSRTLSTTFAAGVPLVEALGNVAGAAGNLVYARAIERVREEITGGSTLNNAMRGTGLFPPLAVQMTAIGEESGALDDMLDRVASHYEAEVDNAVDGLTALLEPVIMSVLAVLIGGILVAMYLPIFQLGSVV
ncbi:MAG: type II secretion system F family protein [Cellvibrionales bacterium]|nr:type II secretion system F family protein [Cellvibrionales bacterium]